MSKQLRVAVVGLGHWAEWAHLPGWQRDPRVEVAAVVDVNGALAERVAKEFDVDRAVTDYREVLEDATIDVVDVATGNDTHFQISWDSIEAGKHVLCEKPVHHDARQTNRTAELARSKGLKTKLGLRGRRRPRPIGADAAHDPLHPWSKSHWPGRKAAERVRRWAYHFSTTTVPCLKPPLVPGERRGKFAERC